MRPANIVTAVSDILAGIAIAGYFASYPGGLYPLPVTLLVLSTIGLYGGGVVFNDVFDAELDKVERPERPIPSGLILKQNAALLGGVLLLIGIVAAAFVHAGLLPSGLIAIAIAIAALAYDKWGKHHPLLGPLNMGICRGLNLLLGISIIPVALYQYWAISLIPVLYIAAITMISRGEVHGGKKRTLYAAAVFYLMVIVAILLVSFTNKTIVFSSAFLVLFGIMIFMPLKKAIQDPKGALIGKAVKAGVLALILMNAAWAAAFGTLSLALFIVLLLPLSLWMAKAFAVT
ncbi:polyprenyltransferase [Ilyomonas limi]|uniref:Polyprenyltransferase n=2 Tax=Ilyomonas limi TaxID=2575867 RepID=A0A4U3L503_9BACT|nr:polyprenyltransferase [Ilyomonas limi]